MNHLSRALTVAVALAFGSAMAPPATAQMAKKRAEERRAQQQQKKADAATQEAPEFPQATREEPGTRASEKGVKTLQALSKAYEAQNYPEVLAIGVPFAQSTENAYEKSFAYQLAAIAASESDDNVKAAQYFQAAVDANGLDNNSHYRIMYNLAAVQSQLEQWDSAVKTLDRFLAETRSEDPKYLTMKAGLLSGAGRNDEASKLFAELLAKNPGDKKLLMNTVATLQQQDKFAEANRLLLDAQKKGLLTEEREYRALYSGLLNEDGRWKEAAAVVEEGAAKGVLQQNQDLGKAYSFVANQAFFANDLAAAVKYYTLAAPLSPDGEAWLNLAKVYNNQGNKAEQRKAAQQALAKWVKDTAEAQRLANPK